MVFTSKVLFFQQHGQEAGDLRQLDNGSAVFDPALHRLLVGQAADRTVFALNADLPAGGQHGVLVDNAPVGPMLRHGDLHIQQLALSALTDGDGAGTGIETKLEKIKRFRDALGDFPLIVGAGVTAETAAQQLAYSDGAIVGTGFKELGITEYPVDEEQVKKLMHNARK